MHLTSSTYLMFQAVELLFLSLHLSVLVCILRKRWNGNAAFRTGFFTLYALQSTADIVDYSFALVYVRLATMGHVPQELFDYPQGNIAYFIMTYAVNLQFVAHAAIAINRYLALTDAWSARTQRWVVIATLLVPLPNAALRFIGHMQLVPTDVPGMYAIIRDVPWMSAGANITIVVYSSVTSAISVFFEIRSLIAYRRLTLVTRKKYHNDFLLLIYSLLQFLVQLSVSICYGLSSYGGYIGDAQLASIGQTANKYIVDVLCLSPAICVLSTSRLLRNAYVEMYWPFSTLKTVASSLLAAPKPVRAINAINIPLGASRTS